MKHLLALSLASAIAAPNAWTAPQGSSTPAGAAADTDAKLRTAPFRVLDTVEGAHVDLALLPVRPLHRTSAGELFAVDAERSELLIFESSGALRGSARLPWGPVSVASWRPSPGGPLMALVVCRGSHSLAVVDAASLELLSLLDLPAEPADILVEPTSNHVFVSGSALDVVVELDVAAGTTLAEYPIPSKRPTFLALDGGTVLVAPMLSGNNSMADTGSGLLDVGPGRVLDLEDPTQAIQGLPDHDLFRITPGGAVEAVATDTGAVLFGLGVHPSTGEVWQLGTEANNKNPQKVGEPAIRGEFIENRLARISLSSGSIVPPLAVHNLDDTDLGTAGIQYSPARSVGQPYGLAFDGAGQGYVAGLLTHNITQLDSSGQFVREWDVGKNPRGLVVDDAGETLWVYAWSQRRIQEYDLTAQTPTLTKSMALGVDPTPELLAAGRSLFFEGQRSMHGNASCASCHIETESDMLVWDLSDMPYDDKGPLATQTMRGIADLGPFHWRGERPELGDFNDAFDGLLGSAPLDHSPGGEFDAFQAYIFSLEQPANPNQDASRDLVNRERFRVLGKWIEGDAIRGQDHYFDTTIISGIGTCNTCHSLPTGTNNEITLDEPFLQFPRRNHFVVASYNGMWRKAQATEETVILAGGVSEERPTLGTGISASGLKDSTLDFIRIPLFEGPDARRRHLAAFLQQLDSGLAPAVHSSFLLRGTDARAQGAHIASYSMAQAGKGNCDLVLVGSLDLGSGPQSVGWLFDPQSGLFSADDSSLPDQPLSFFVDEALAGNAAYVALGLPRGMGARFALDSDFDGLANGDELALGTNPDNPDSDGDGDLDGTEFNEGGDPTDPGVGASDTTAPIVSNLRVVFVTSSVAKLQFDTNELATWEASWTSGQQAGTAASEGRERTHTVILNGLRGNNKLHNVSIDVTDLSGNLVTVPVTDEVRTLPAINNPTTLYRDPSINVTTDSAGTLAFSLEGKARIKFGPFATGRRIKVNVFKNGVLTQENLQGDTSGSDGITTVQITESGLVAGDVIEVAVMTLRNMASGDEASWSFPDTPKDNRRFAVPYTGVGP